MSSCDVMHVEHVQIVLVTIFRKPNTRREVNGLDYYIILEAPSNNVVILEHLCR
jgi:hypothetical protein